MIFDNKTRSIKKPNIPAPGHSKNKIVKYSEAISCNE